VLFCVAIYESLLRELLPRDKDISSKDSRSIATNVRL
jgi:hypothetical protein